MRCRRRRRCYVRDPSQVDGAYAAVKFPSKDGDVASAASSSSTGGAACGGQKDDAPPLSASGGGPAAALHDCRLLRRDELVAVRGVAAPRIPDCFQRTPRRVVTGSDGRVLAVTVDNQGEWRREWPCPLQ